MKLTNTKNALLFVLIIGVILQTAQLWFEVYSSHNFFYSLLARRTRFTEETYKIEPQTILTNINGTIFVPVAINEQSGLKTVCDGLITQILKNGKFISSAPLNWIEVLEFKSVVYEYPGAVTTESFAQSYGVRGTELRGKVAKFDTIIISPQRTMSETMKFYIIDSSVKTTYTFELLNTLPETISKEIDKLAVSDLTYVSSIKNGLDFFSAGNAFLPQWKQSYFSYSPAYVTNPIDDANNLEKSVELFFDNPVGIVSATDSNGTPFFSSENTVVKYYKNDGLLEYTNYTQGKKTASAPSFADSYATALNFMKRDVTLKNDICLTGFSFMEGVWTLYFDYKLDDFSVFIEGENGAIKHAIEISIDKEIVSKYGRIVKALASAERIAHLERNYIEVLDDVIADETAQYAGTLDDMDIGYVITENGPNELTWLVKAGGLWRKDNYGLGKG